MISQCIMYKTFSSIILNRFESLNLRLLNHIANIKPRSQIRLGSREGEGEDEEEALNSGLVAGPGDRGGTPLRAETPAREGTPLPGAGKSGTGPRAGASTPGGGSGGTGGGKKKKKGKR